MMEKEADDVYKRNLRDREANSAPVFFYRLPSLIA
jgi:hypothetical protein